MPKNDICDGTKDGDNDTMVFFAKLGVVGYDSMVVLMRAFGESVHPRQREAIAQIMRGRYRTSEALRTVLEQNLPDITGNRTRDFGPVVQVLVSSKKFATVPTREMVDDYLGGDHSVRGRFVQFLGTEVPDWLGDYLVELAKSCRQRTSFPQVLSEELQRLGIGSEDEDSRQTLINMLATRWLRLRNMTPKA